MEERHEGKENNNKSMQLVSKCLGSERVNQIGDCQLLSVSPYGIC